MPYSTSVCVAVAIAVAALPPADAAVVPVLDGDWHGTETCVAHCCGDPGHCQGTAMASLIDFKGGNGTYSIGDNTMVAVEFKDGEFASGHIINTDGALHGTFIVQANATRAWGSWIAYGSKRLFQWDFVRGAAPPSPPTPPAPPPPPPPPPCASATTAPACAASVAGCFWSDAGTCLSRVVEQVDIFTQNTVSPWGTTYACFRVPSAVRVPPTTGGRAHAQPHAVLVFVESRIGSCGDQAPKDVTMKRSEDGGRTWGPLTLVVGPRAHGTGLDFSARNPYATVAANGDVILNWVNSTRAANATSWQRTSSDGGVTWSTDSHMKDMGIGYLDGTLLGPGEGIVLGRHASVASPYKGRIVTCGATGYVPTGFGGQGMAVWTSDDNGKTYILAKGKGTWPDLPGYDKGNVTMPFKGLAECQIVELNSGAVMVNMRNEIRTPAQPPSHTHHRAVAVSHDGGRSFGAYRFDPELIEPTCMAGLINFGGTLYFSNPASQTHRDNMTLKSSTDSGATWGVEASIWSGPAAYSLVVPLSDDSGPEAGTLIGVVYERGTTSSYEHMSIAIVDVRK